MRVMRVSMVATVVVDGIMVAYAAHGIEQQELDANPTSAMRSDLLQARAKNLGTILSRSFTLALPLTLEPSYKEDEET